MKKTVFFLMFVLFGRPIFAHWDTIYEGYPNYYPTPVIPDTHWYDGIMCIPRFLTWSDRVSYYDLGGWASFNVGYTADTTLHVIGLAASMYSMRVTRPDDTSRILFNCGEIVLSSPSGDTIQQMRKIAINNMTASRANKILLINDDGGYGIYVYEDFFAREITINNGDTFYLAANICDNEKTGWRMSWSMGWFECHSSWNEGDNLHWPAHEFRGKYGSLSAPWQIDSTYGIPTVWLIIRRDEDTSTTDTTAIRSVEAVPTIDLLLAPNPAAGRVTVTLPQGVRSLTVHSVDGREVYRNDTPAETFDIDVSRWARGIYTVGIESDRGSTTRKLVVE